MYPEKYRMVTVTIQPGLGTCCKVCEIYGELPAPEEEVFPFENEVLQWMGEYLCVSEK